MINQFLSIWEVAHRWRNASPDTTDSANLPLDVQDAIRYICRGILDSEIHLLHMVVMKPALDKILSYPRSSLTPFFESNPPPEIEKALYREYDKNILNSYFVEAENLFDYCVNQQSNGLITTVDFPTCWSHLIGNGHPIENESEANDHPKVTQPQLRPTQIDKLVCQAIARTLWDEQPKMTIAAMTEHKAILEYGGGKLYKGKNTLRDWLSEVAPPDAKKPGRPPKVKSH